MILATVTIFGYDKITSGASLGVKQAPNLSRTMITKCGMSDKTRPTYHNRRQNVHRSHIISENSIKILMDEEVNILMP